MYWLAYIIIDATTNWYLIEKKNIRPNHDLFGWIRLVALVVIGLAIGVKIGVDLFVWGLFCWSSFWVLFDIVLNLMRGKSWNYIGITDGEDANSDEFGLKHPYLFWASKIIALVVCIASIVLYYKL